MNIKFLLIPLTCFLALQTACADNGTIDDRLYSFETSKDGYINAKGEVVIEPRFDDSYMFYADIAAIKLNDKWGFINKKGEIVIKPQFDDVVPYGGEVIIISVNKTVQEKNGKTTTKKQYGLMNGKGEIVAKPQYDGIMYFADNYSLLRVEQNGKYGVMNAQGKLTIPIELDDIRFYYGYIEAQKGALSADIDAQGYVVGKEIRFKNIGDFENGIAKVWTKTGFGFIDKEYNIIIEPIYDDAYYDYKEDIIILRDKDGKFGFADTKGKIIFEPKFTGYGVFDNGLAAVQAQDSINERNQTVKGKWGFINKKGEWVIAPRFSGVKNFTDNTSTPAASGELWGTIDMKGEWVIKPKFNSLYGFSKNGLAAARGGYDEGWSEGYINRKGEWVIAPRFGGANNFDDCGVALVTYRSSNGQSLINEKGRVITSHPHISNFNKHCVAWVRDDNPLYGKKSGESAYRYSFINAKGKVLLNNIESLRAAEEGSSVGGAYDSVFGYNGLAIINGGTLVNEKGEIVSEKSFTSIMPFDHKGRASVVKNTKIGDTWGDRWGVIDNKGKVIADALYDRPFDFEDNGLAIVIQGSTGGEYDKYGDWRDNGKRGVINDKGETIVKPRFYAIHSPSVKLGGLMLAWDSKGENATIYYIDAKDNIVAYNEMVNGKRVLKNGKGEIVWE